MGMELYFLIESFSAGLFFGWLIYFIYLLIIEGYIT